MAIKNNKLVMVLEDDTDLAEGIELSLQSDELNFVICETIAEARKALEHYSFDLLIFDINLPDGNGLEFCRELKRKIQSSRLTPHNVSPSQNRTCGFPAYGSS